MSIFCDKAGNNLSLLDSYSNQAVFLVCSGPSLQNMDLQLLEQRGLMCLAVNNAATLVRPQLWVSVDDPGNFVEAIWRDPAIQKFTPVEHFDKTIYTRDSQGVLAPSSTTVQQMPNVVGFKRNEDFVADRYLTEPSVNWGMHGKASDAYGQRGSRSVMLAAIKILYHLGFRRTYLLGCDFKMELGKANYAFDQDRSASSVRGNNRSYESLNIRFQHLLPYFEKAGLEIRNCTPDSGLRAFPYLEYTQAITEALRDFPKDMQTAGMYDRLKRERDAERALQTIPANAKQKNETSTPPKNIDFTTVVGVDAKHLAELKLVWPTWKRHRPEIFRQPMLLICDADRAEAEWNQLLAFVDHPKKEIVLWSMPGVSQREKMLTGLVVCPARHVRTPWYLKLDTDAAAIKPGNWCDPAWFAPDAGGRLPVFVSSPWGYTRPVEWLQQLDDWGDHNLFMKDHPRLNLPIDAKHNRIKHPRITSWYYFGNTEWTRQVVEAMGERMIVPSQDTFLWYCAARRREHFRRIKVRDIWKHTCHFRKLKAFCEKALGYPKALPTSEPVQEAPAIEQRGVTFLLTGIRHAVRLAVCLRSLREHYQGSVTVFTTRPESHRLVERMKQDVRLQIEHQIIPEVQRPKHGSFLTKVSMTAATPYQTTVFLDADTLVTGSLEELFQGAEKEGFTATRFSNWVTSGGTMRKRILPWGKVAQHWLPTAEYQTLLQQILQGQPAINSGIFAYQRQTPLLAAWWKLVEAGWQRFLPDEIALQIVLSKYPHCLLDHRFNQSAKYGPYRGDTRVWHFHGDKHYGRERANRTWLPQFQKCSQENWGGIQEWFPAEDKVLKKCSLAELLEYGKPDLCH